MLKRSDIINYFVHRCGYRRYLEIGVEAGATFNAVKAPVKFAVDPCFQITLDALDGQIFETTSDKFFDENPDEIFDIIFIDGLHIFEQSLRDFTRAMNRITKGGIILLDDCNPSDYLASIRDHELCRTVKEREGYADRDWMGDVYKTALFIHDYFRDVSLAYLRDTAGIVAVWHGSRAIVPVFETVEEIARCDFVSFKEKVLPLIPQRTVSEIGDSVLLATTSGAPL